MRTTRFVCRRRAPRVLLAYPDAHIFELDGAGIRQVTYTESQVYQTARDFFPDLARMLDRLLRNDA